MERADSLPTLRVPRELTINQAKTSPKGSFYSYAFTERKAIYIN